MTLYLPQNVCAVQRLVAAQQQSHVCHALRKVRLDESIFFCKIFWNCRHVLGTLERKGMWRYAPT